MAEDVLYVVMAYNKDDSSPLAVPVFIADTGELAQAAAEEFLGEGREADAARQKHNAACQVRYREARDKLLAEGKSFPDASLQAVGRWPIDRRVTSVGVHICAVPAGRRLSLTEFDEALSSLYAILPFDR